MLPQIVPMIADALAQAKLVTISNGGDQGAPEATTNNITSVIQTVLAAQLVFPGLIEQAPNASQANLPSSLSKPSVGTKK